MKWNNKYNYPKSQRSIENGFRKYLFGDEKLPSVTTILSQTKSEEEKAALELWKKALVIKKQIESKQKHLLEDHQCTHILRIT